MFPPASERAERMHPGARFAPFLPPLRGRDGAARLPRPRKAPFRPRWLSPARIFMVNTSTAGAPAWICGFKSETQRNPMAAPSPEPNDHRPAAASGPARGSRLYFLLFGVQTAGAGILLVNGVPVYRQAAGDFSGHRPH